MTHYTRALVERCVAMIIGVPKEIKRDEHRVRLPPAARAINIDEGEIANLAVAEMFGLPHKAVA
jgi:hypothetical protein